MTEKTTPYEKKQYTFFDRRDAARERIESNGDIFISAESGMYTYDADGKKREVLGYQKRKKSTSMPMIALYDSSFPVYGLATLVSLTGKLAALNRKTCEHVSVDVYDYNHVIDFNDRIIFNGHDYYLEQNIVTKTPRIVNRQSLDLVRWF